MRHDSLRLSCVAEAGKELTTKTTAYKHKENEDSAVTRPCPGLSVVKKPPPGLLSHPCTRRKHIDSGKKKREGKIENVFLHSESIEDFCLMR